MIDIFLVLFFVGISKNEKFKEKFQEEKELINLSLELHDLREK
ncbi:hypothetical protein LEP1GSC108_0189, partial [Leptospira weilii str. UI 13098]